MPRGGLGLALVTENVVIDTVAEVVAGERVLAHVNLAVLGPGVVVLDVEHHFAPAVADAQLVVAVLVGVFRIDVGVEVADGPHVVDAVAVGRDHIRENQVVFKHHRVAHGVASAALRHQRQGHHVVAPAGINVRRVDLSGRFLTVTEVPD